MQAQFMFSSTNEILEAPVRAIRATPVMKLFTDHYTRRQEGSRHQRYLELTSTNTKKLRLLTFKNLDYNSRSKQLRYFQEV